jgi:hypothetical protein
MTGFLDIQPTVENRWRALVLFGRNVATYKFALGRVLLGFADRADDLVPLDEIALPYALAICDHLKAAPKQATSASSQFLDDCRAFNAGELTQDQLRDAAVRRGFNNVVDAFHRLGPADLDRRFFMDERKGSGGLRLTDDLRALAASRRPTDLAHENEARWRLVETAWELGLSRSLIEFEVEGETLTVQRRDRRVAVTSCRAALNGYQKGHCFYCFRGIGIEGDDDVADIDHFLPWAIRSELGVNLDGVWNLVLACRDCNQVRLASSTSYRPWTCLSA